MTSKSLTNHLSQVDSRDRRKNPPQLKVEFKHFFHNTPKENSNLGQLEHLKLLEHIEEHGLGAKAPTLAPDLPADIFRKHYYDKKTLMEFCRHQNIPTQGLKNDLSERIESFLRTGEVPEKPSPRKNHSPPDSQLGLTLDKKVVHYKSDPVTREFFSQHIRGFTGFSAYVQKWIKQRLSNAEEFTYSEIIEEHKRFLQEKLEANLTGTARKVAHDSCQYNQFFIDYAHDIDKKAHPAKEAWKLVRNSAGEKTYARYKKEIEELTKKLNTQVPT